jgi:DNA repair exonuclease SbcCD ATPase subunit/DNA repair exonuclease SbcCD nuclease subunit
MIVLKNTDKKIDFAIQVSDIHIRLTKRHTEYSSVFDKFYGFLDKLGKNASAICVVTGDVFHNKSDLSPECVHIGIDFLKNCANRMPTILIAGNHDATLANKSRLDCLTPIVQGLNHPNLYYLKSSDIFRYENILFNHFSVFDDPDKYIKYDNIQPKYRHETEHHVALFHGPVNNAVTDVGYTVSNRAITNELFDGHQIVMLGDIHKHQILQEYDDATNKPVVAYAGSMIQQNHGEDLKGHGFLLWDLKRKMFKHYELTNDYGFYTIEINKGKLLTDITDLPKKVRIRAKCFESIPSQVKDVMSELKQKCEILESTFIRVDEFDTNNTKVTHLLDIHNIFNVDYQNKLIEDSLTAKKVDAALIEKVKILNKTINTQIPTDKTPKNIRWKPKIFEFDNMFSYGEGNFIDFTQLRGTIGLFAPNAAGKSSIMDALAFCVFDKFSKGYKATHVLNTQKMTFKCKFNFEVSGVDYFIEREGKADKKGNIKVEVKFYKLENGNEVPLNGEARRNTNDIIRDYVGTYEDFILTVLSIQNSKTGSFVDLGQTERKDLLCQFMGLNVFDQLYTIANENFKETNTLLKNISKDQLDANLVNISDSIDINQSNIISFNSELATLEQTKDVYNNNLLQLSKNIVKFDSVKCVDIVGLVASKIDYEKNVGKIQSDIVENKTKMELIELQLSQLSSSLKSCENIETTYQEYKDLKKLEESKQHQIDRLKVVIKSKVDKLKKLEEHKYDPNCEYCVNNVFVKDAIATKQDLENEKINAAAIMVEYNTLKTKIVEFGDIETIYQTCQTVNTDKIKLEKRREIINTAILRDENYLITLQNTLKATVDAIDSFYKNKDTIENNQLLLNQIDEHKTIIKDIEFKIKSMNSQLFTASTEKGKLELQYKNTTDQLNKVKELEISYEAYKLYTAVISRDGIPYEVITKTLPEIEKEVNNILNQIVEFTVTLTTDGKNIMSNIVYDDKRWPLEMASGMEKFVSGLAIRVALINFSNLPRPNIICIDEGWGTLDNSHISSVSNLFTYLKHQFDFIWIISHLDSIKDSVDVLLEITKESGFSKIVYK